MEAPSFVIDDGASKSMRSYYRNRDARLAGMKAYRASEKGRANAEKTRAQRRASSRRYYAAHTEKLNAAGKVWREKNGDKLAEYVTKRRAMRKHAPGHHTAADRLAVLNEYHHLCVYCNGTATTLDHVIPLTRGGSNGRDNLAPACLSCNSRKHNTPLIKWMVRRAQ